jgi:hypothetical protein
MLFHLTSIQKHIHEIRCPNFFCSSSQFKNTNKNRTCMSTNISTSLYKFILQFFSMLQASEFQFCYMIMRSLTMLQQGYLHP